MDDVLLALLLSLEQVGKSNEELYDTEVRERMSGAVFSGFLRPDLDFVLGEDFGLNSKAANNEVRTALANFLQDANAFLHYRENLSFHDRLALFQRPSVRTSDEKIGYDDVFGYWNPKFFDADGNAITS